MAILNTYSANKQRQTAKTVVDIVTDTLGDAVGSVPIVGSNLKNVVSILPQLFAKGGVSSDFFSKFPFLAFLDNSTGSWKSRYSKQSSWTPNERIAWYIQLINEKGISQDAIQYAELYGNMAKITGDRKYETDQVDYDLAYAFNSVCLYTFFTDGNNLIVSGSNRYPKEYILLDLSITKNKGKSIISNPVKMDDQDLGNPNNPDKQNEQHNQTEKTPVNGKIKDNKYPFIAGVGSILYGIFKLFV